MALNEFFQRQEYEYRYLEAMRVGIRADPLAGRYVGRYSSEAMELRRIFDPMLLELRTFLLTDKLGDKEIREERTVDHECVRFATWWDHWKATYRGRWWMRWRRWTVRYNIEHHPLTARVSVDMSRYWTFPEADVYPDSLGAAVPYIKNQRMPVTYGSEHAWWNERED